MAVTSCASGVTAQPGPASVPASAGPASAGPASAGPASPRPTGAADQPRHPGQAGDRTRGHRVRMLAVRNQFAGCEEQITLPPRPRPTLAIVGGSYTAG